GSAAERLAVLRRRRGARGLALAERVAAVERVPRGVGFLVLGQHFWKRGQRQAVSERGVALDEEDLLAPQRPRGREPRRLVAGLRARGGLQRQHESRGLAGP